MLSVVWRVAAGWIVVLALACVATPAPAPPQPRPVAQLPSTAPSPLLKRVRPRATEVGFTHCCGSEAYKLEIDCGDMVMRCYRRATDGRWRLTYGRLCHEYLGEACYPTGCEEVCPMRGSR